MAFICKISIVKNNITSRWRRLRHLRSKSTNHIREIKIIWPRDKSIMWIYGSSTYWGSSTLHVTTLPGLVARGLVVVERKYFWYITWLHVATCSKGCVTYDIKFLLVSHHFAKFTGHRSVVVVMQQLKYFTDLARPRDQRIWWLYLLILYPHPAKSDSHRHCVNEYIIILVCLSHDAMRPGDYMVMWLYG